MNNVMLKKIVGEWIWFPCDPDRNESNIFFRNDFSLNETPGKAEIWISVKTDFHLFVNGRHCAASSVANPTDNQYAFLFDITYLVQIGVNQIAVHAFNANAPLSGNIQENGGMWLQLHIDDVPTLWTDKNWLCFQALCYQKTGLKRAIGASEIEKIDFQKYPLHWKTAPLEKLDDLLENPEDEYDLNLFWHHPKIIERVKKGRYTLETTPETIDMFEPCPWKELISAGQYLPSYLVLWVEFNSIMKQNGLGVFMAETYVYVPTNETHLAELFSDRPYQLFVNDQEVSCRGKNDWKEYDEPALCSKHFLEIRGCRGCSVEMTLFEGWNRIVLFKDCSAWNTGIMLRWTDLKRDKIHVMQAPQVTSAEGWNITGPLQTPFSLVSPAISTESLPCEHYSMTRNYPPDVSVYLDSCVFNAAGAERLKQQDEPHFVGNKEYLVFDFKKTLLGYAELKIQGSKGDVVDIVCGEQMVDGEVIAYTGGRRNLSTVILSGMVDEWLSTSVQGFRYVMVLARKVTGVVTLEKVQARVPSQNIPPAGSFRCSNEVLNRIWDVGVETLSSTVRCCFLDAPCRDQAQFIADAMIQSWAVYHLNGSFALVEKAIEGFAHTQLETGEINSISPSGIFQVLPDYSLLWIVWLHRHILYTGNKAMLKKLFPVLKKLLQFYNYQAVTPEGPLPDMRDYHGTYCFLDHADIDRKGVCTGLNAIYCRALISAVYLAELIDRHECAQAWKRRAALVSTQMRQLTWDEQKGLFADSYHLDGTRSTQYSWQTNVLAIYGGIAKTENFGPIWNLLFTEEEPYERFAAGEFNNPYFKFFILESAFALGLNVWAMHLIRYYWGTMLEAGATSWWELFDPTGTEQSLRLISKCHGYAVSPNIYFISELVGIRPAEPGMKRVYFNPLPGEVTWVNAFVPTPHGRILVKWEMDDNRNLSVFISSNTPLEVIPVISAKLVESIELNVGENVTVLAQEE